MKIVILTTLYNAENYIERCLSSIIGQSFKYFKCYITDDMSTDNSVSLAKKMTEGDDRFVLIENNIKLYQPGNYDQVIRNKVDIADCDICCEIDGDDWLPNSKVLQKIYDTYEDSNIWVTNGSFKYSDGRDGFSKEQIIDSNLRKNEMTCSHMRTWKAFLWRNIQEEDLKDEFGNYWSVTGDLSFMFPMLEMAGQDRYKFIEDITYIYNEDNPINDHKVNIQKVTSVANKIRNKTCYKKLNI